MSILDPLLDLQSIDEKLRECRQISNDIPLRKEQASQRLQQIRDDLAAVHDKLTEAQAKIAEVELEIRSRREKIQKLREQQLQLKTNREFKAMELEISVLENEIDRFETAEIEAMDAMEPLKLRQDEVQSRLKAANESVQRDIEELDRRLEHANALCAGLTEKRQQTSPLVDAKLLLSYERLLAGKWPPLVPMEEDACGGCHMSQPPAVRNAARQRNGVVTCQFCGRMLY